MRARHTVLASALLLGTLALVPQQAGAADSAPAPAASAVADPLPDTYPIVLSGDFTGDDTGDLFFHSPSSAPDVLYDFNPPGSDDVNRIDIYTYAVTGNYRPVVGTFGGDSGTDDIVWYQPGAAADVIWDFLPCGICTARPEYRRLPISVNGNYKPVAGIFRESTRLRDDIVWYAPGTAADSWWDFTPPTCSGCPPVHRSLPLTINGAGYEPVSGHFIGTGGLVESIYWYNPAGAESLWDWSQLDGRYVSYSPPSIQVAGTSYELAVSDLFGDTFDDIVFVGPGAAQDSVWNFVEDGFFFKVGAPESLTGAYTAVVGVVQGLREPGNDSDFFVYDPHATAGRYYDIFEEDGEFFFQTSDFDPAPLTELPPAAPVRTATAAEPRRWLGADARAGAASAAPEGRRWTGAD